MDYCGATSFFDPELDQEYASGAYGYPSRIQSMLGISQHMSSSQLMQPQSTLIYQQQHPTSTPMQLQYQMPASHVPANTSFYNDFSQQYVPYEQVYQDPITSLTVSNTAEHTQHLPAAMSGDSIVSFQGVVTDCNNTGLDHKLQFYYDLIAQEILGVDIPKFESMGMIPPYVVIIQPDYSRTHFFCAKLPTGSMYFGINTWLEHNRKFRYKVWFPIIHPSAFETTLTSAFLPQEVMIFFDRRSGQLLSCCQKQSHSRSFKPTVVASHPKELVNYFSIKVDAESPPIAAIAVAGSGSGMGSSIAATGSGNTVLPSIEQVIEFAVSCKHYQQTVRYEVLSPLPSPVYFECDLSDPLQPGSPTIPVAVYYDRKRNGMPFEAKVVGYPLGCSPQLIPNGQHSYNGNLFFFTLPPPYAHLQFHLIQKDFIFTVIPYQSPQMVASIFPAGYDNRYFPQPLHHTSNNSIGYDSATYSNVR